MKKTIAALLVAAVMAAGATPASAAGFDLWAHGKEEVNKYVEKTMPCEFLGDGGMAEKHMGIKGKTVDEAYNYLTTLKGPHALTTYLKRALPKNHPAMPPATETATANYLGARILQKTVKECKATYLKDATSEQVDAVLAKADKEGAAAAKEEMAQILKNKKKNGTDKPKPKPAPTEESNKGFSSLFDSFSSTFS